MVIFKEVIQIESYINRLKNDGKKIGFVPTMGALHNGHLSLIATSKKNNAVTVCSIFVNPTQFNNHEDFKHYPVTIEKDIEALTKAGCSILFMPSVLEIYPPGFIKKQYQLGAIENLLEGKYRPGHFQGVCQVVDRLLEIVQPNNLYLGQKDFQQCMVIKKMLYLIGKEKEIELMIAPTLREADGLAMSSRNLRLNNEQRKAAPLLFKELTTLKKNIRKHSFEKLKTTAKGFLFDKHSETYSLNFGNSIFSKMPENSTLKISTSG